MAETAGNPAETDSELPVTLEMLYGLQVAHAQAIGHQDELIHALLRMVTEMHEVFAEHKPVIARAAAVAGMGKFIKGGRRAVPQGQQR